jgi:uncharacterized protein YmfQ (DUF2313 family)
MRAAELAPEDFARALHALLPRGVAWPREPGTVQAQAVAGLADIVAALHGRAGDLSEIESDPARTVELLADWERAYGLPNPCVGEGQTIQERRDALLARIAGAGGQSRAYFIAVAAALGFTITITEFDAFVVGASAVGDPLHDEPWRFAWQVNAPEDTVRDFRVGASAVGDPLRGWGNAALECVLTALAPAHTKILFAYGA